MIVVIRSPLKHVASSRFGKGVLSNSRSFHKANDDIWNKTRVNAFVGHNFPDFIEGWNRDTFKQVGYGMTGLTGILGLGGAMLDVGFLIPATLVGGLTAAYWTIGLADIRQKSHAIRRNFPVLGNFRYVMETIRPELYQYIGKFLSISGLHDMCVWHHGKLGTARQLMPCHPPPPFHILCPTDVWTRYIYLYVHSYSRI